MQLVRACFFAQIQHQASSKVLSQNLEQAAITTQVPASNPNPSSLANAPAPAFPPAQAPAPAPAQARVRSGVNLLYYKQALKGECLYKAASR